MPQVEQHKFFINFTGGLNTEATPLNFPENSAQEVDNFDLFRTGEIKRRRGIEFENGYTVRPETTAALAMDTAAISTHEWKAVNGRGDTNFAVVQIGTKLFFHDLGAEPLSGSLRGSVDLGSFKTGASPADKIFDTAFGEGIMIVANEEMDTVTIEFDHDLNTFTATAILIQVRDFDGIDDFLETDERPQPITAGTGVTLALHRYNLHNQGWPTSATVNVREDGGDGVQKNTDPIAATSSKIGVQPSNADIFYSAKASAAEDPEVIGSYSPFELEKNIFGNTPAPKGHFILDAFSKDRVSADNPGNVSLNVPIEAISVRPRVVAFYAGRVWYFGVPDREFTGDIFFSQSLTDISVAGNCYQDQDPTAEDLNTLLATDGGIIHIADMGQVHWAGQVGQDLIVASSTGMYAVSGSSGGDFTADDFSVRKITNDGAVGRQSVLEVEGSVFWWAEGGIWNMQSANSVDRELQVNRITKDTIQTFYDEIPAKARAYVRGYYDSFSKKVYWLYNDTEGYDALNFRFRYNRALVLDLTLGAFYTYSISDLTEDTPWMSSLLLKTPSSETTVQYDIFVGDDDVEEAGDDIVQDVSFETFSDTKLKVLVFVVNADSTYSYTFAEFFNTSFTDWKIWDTFKHLPTDLGENYDSILHSGWNDFADPIRLKNITHLTSFFNRTEDGYELDENLEVQYTNPSGAFVQTRWEYTDLDNGYWTTLEQAYRLLRQFIPEDENDPFDFGYTVVQSKLRMRGQGHAFSIRYESEDGKDLQLLGFAVNVRAPQKV